MKRRPAASDIDRQAFRRRLLAWFKSHRRDLPWRIEPRNAYRVWVAETMLQQTQVVSVIPYYERWLSRFPTLQSLAQADLDTVLKLWEGLGYYTRVRNLHKAAQVIVRDYGSALPDQVNVLQRLPGIGAYTAGAIASLAYGRDAAVLDGNIKRVLARVYAVNDKVTAPGTVKHLWKLARELLPPGKAGQFNEALMDLGALICTPRTPACGRCPVARLCIAYSIGKQAHLPLRRGSKTLPLQHIATAVIQNDAGQYLISQRPTDGLLGGLWEFPGCEVVVKPGSQLLSSVSQQAVQAQLTRYVSTHAGVDIQQSTGRYLSSHRYAYTHRRISRHVFSLRTAGRTISAPATDARLRWLHLDDIDRLALARNDRRILQHITTSTQSE